MLENTPNYSRRLRNLRLHIGRKSYCYRSRMQLSLAEFSECTEYSSKVLERYEIGKRNVRLDELLRIAYVLKVKVRDLI